MQIDYSQSISILGLESGATEAEIKKAYRRLAKEYHPDRYRADGGEKFKEINSAYRFLKDNTYPLSDQQEQNSYQEADGKHAYYKDRRRAAYYRHRRKKNVEAEQREQMFSWLFHKLRFAVFAILLFNSLLALDYLLPKVQEQVKVSHQYTKKFVTKGSAHYEYVAKLSNGQTFKLSKQQLIKTNFSGSFTLSKSFIFGEPIYLQAGVGERVYQYYGLFKIFGILIPITIALLLAYLLYVQNHDYRLSIFLLVLFIFIFQLFLYF